jgi:hypothetical protein
MADEESPQDLLSQGDDFIARKISQISGLDGASLGSNDLEDDEDASSDEEDAAAVQDDILMAERTNQLMTDFRSYITEIQGSSSDPGTAKDGKDTVDAEYGEHPNPSQQQQDGALMRAWGDSPSQPYKDNPSFTVNQGYGDIHDDVILSRSPYSRQVYSKKLKKCILLTVFTGTLTAVILGIVHSIHERNVEKRLPDWEGELKAMEEEKATAQSSSGGGTSNTQEQQHTEQMSHNPQVGEGLQTSEKDAAYYADAQGLDEYGGNAPSMMNGAHVDDKHDDVGVKEDISGPSYVAVEETYSPVWFDRDSGWSGETYDQGLIFCAGRKDSEGGSMVRVAVAVCMWLISICLHLTEDGDSF